MNKYQDSRCLSSPFCFLTMRFICRVQRAQYHTSRGSFTSLSVTWGLWQSWWYRLWQSWHSTSWFPIVTVICLRQRRTQRVRCASGGLRAAQEGDLDGPADHARQAHFHGEVVSVGLVIVADVRKEVFAGLDCNWGGTILLFLQTGLFWRVHVDQINSDLCGGGGGTHLGNGCWHQSNNAVKQ